MIPTLHIQLLGDFLLVLDDHPVTAVHTPRLQSVLAYLVLHRTAPQTRAHLAFLLWPDLTEAQAHANLRKALYHLRQALPSLDQFLRVERQYLHWQPSRQDAPWTLDVQGLEQGLAQAEQAAQAQDMSLMRQALERAVDLYRGDQHRRENGPCVLARTVSLVSSIHFQATRTGRRGATCDHSCPDGARNDADEPVARSSCLARTARWRDGQVLGRSVNVHGLLLQMKAAR